MPTFDEIVATVRDDLNLTSTDSLTRIQGRVNKRYKEVLGKIGAVPFVRRVEDFNIDPTDPDSELPDYEVAGFQKVTRVQLVPAEGRVQRLDEFTYEDLTELDTQDAVPKRWALKHSGSNTVIITVDSFPTTDSFTLRITGFEDVSTLADDDIPDFPEIYHDVLIAGAKADELMKMEKPDLSKEWEQNYQQRLGELIFYVTKSYYLDQYPSKNKIQRPILSKHP